MARKGKKGLPDTIGLYVNGDRVECVVSPDIAEGSGGIATFRLGQLTVDSYVFQGDSEYDGECQDICVRCQLEAADNLACRVADIFVLARALFMKGELRRHEIKALLDGSANGKGGVL
jgi:hypothetical protein